MNAPESIASPFRCSVAMLRLSARLNAFATYISKCTVAGVP